MAFTQRIGRAGEYLAASFLIRHFEEVFEASSSSRYDYLAQSLTESYKIQVKTTESPFKHHSSTYVRWDIKKKVNKISVDELISSLELSNQKSLRIKRNKGKEKHKNKSK